MQVADTMGQMTSRSEVGRLFGPQDGKLLDAIRIDRRTKIVGVDPSLRSTGVVLFDPDDDTPEWFVIRSKPERDGTVHARVRAIMEYTMGRFGPALMAIEGYNYGKNFSSGFSSVIEIGGVMKSVGGLVGWIQVPPMTWKSAVMGPGWVRAGKKTKADLAKYMARFHKVGGPDSIDQVDAADAWMIAKCVSDVLSGVSPRSAIIMPQLEKLAKLPRML